jgi:ATP-dependent Lon protease
MSTFVQREQVNDLLEKMPESLPILPLRNIVAFPYSVLPLVVGIPRSVKLVEEALEGDRLIGMVAMKDSSVDEPHPGQVYETGTVGLISRVVHGPDDKLHVVVQGLERFHVDHWAETDPYLKAKVRLAPEAVDQEDLAVSAMERSLRELATEVIRLSPNLPDEAINFINQIEDPRYLSYLVAANAGMNIEDGQKLLEMDGIGDKFEALIGHLSREKELLSLGNKIKSDAKEEMDKAQREYFLRQQLKAIKKELGETDDADTAAEEYYEKFDEVGLPEEARKEAERELKRMQNMAPHSAEYSVIKTYLDWLVELPWNELSEDQLEVNHARRILDEDHFDLTDVKDRLIEYLAVRKLVDERSTGEENEEDREKPEEAKTAEGRGVLLCLAGPPGVGKTSLGQSIARAMGRSFTRMSLGGMRDEAEIRGHRRTYIGAMPGRIIQAIKRAGTRNPVFMLDEIDKVGNDWRGDPSSALLEVLDPAQNHAYRDHYLDVDFDLSEVIFITTANQLETIPAPLKDRMEIIQLDGYTEYEKVRIAQDHLIQRQVKANGLTEDEIHFTEEALRKMIRDYTREAGVRNLERVIGNICRKTVVRIAAGEEHQVEITPDLVREYLKKEQYESEASENIEIPGIATGLAVTAVGGDILFVEATRMNGKGELTLTGQLGDVMRESAQIAHSYVRSKADHLGVRGEVFKNNDVHLHVPAGAIPKDGPSAGVAAVLAMASLYTGVPVRSDTGMTGEVTLRGRVMPVGGIKMKVLAAHRAGLNRVILPKRNEKDLEELPEEVMKDITFILVERIEEALEHGLARDKAPEENCGVFIQSPQPEREGWETPYSA